MATESTLPAVMSIELIRRLVKEDVIGGSVTRCIIDAQIGHPLRLIVEHHGDQRTIDAVVDVLCGVTGEPKPQSYEEMVTCRACSSPTGPANCTMPWPACGICGLPCLACSDKNHPKPSRSEKKDRFCRCDPPAIVLGHRDGFACSDCGGVIDHGGFTRFMRGAGIDAAGGGDEHRYVSSGLVELLGRAGR